MTRTEPFYPPELDPKDPKNGTMPRLDPLEIFAQCRKEGRPVLVAGPMVRYSKLPFRELVRDYAADIVYSPMMLAREFVRNHTARISDLTTNARDRCLVIQVGANNVTDLLRVVEMVHPYCDAVGLNCGCPVKEQVREGIGAALMSDADKVAKMVAAVKEKYGNNIRIETKIRIHDNVDQTIEFVRKVEAAGVDWITIHGRTKDTRSSTPANIDAIKRIREHITKVPVVANGDYFKPEDLLRIVKATNVDGVMAVRGILNNPCLLAGFEKTTWGAVEKFWNYAVEYGLPFRIVQHHLSCMLEESLSRDARKQLNELNSMVAMINWFDTTFRLKRAGEPDFGKDISVADAFKQAIVSSVK